MSDFEHQEGVSRRMTVANIRESSETDFAEIVFLESARFYRLLHRNPKYDLLLRLLRTALKQGRPLEVRLTSMDSDIIENVNAP